MVATREELIRRKDELEKRLSAISRDLRSGLDADSKEQAIQLENIDVLQEIARIAEEELQQLKMTLSALAKDP